MNVKRNLESLCFLVTTFVLAASQTCVKMGSSPCSCKSTSGDRDFVFDLSSLDATKNPRFQLDNGGYTYYYQPCTPVDVTSCTLQGVSLCQTIVLTSTTLAYDCGDTMSTTFTGSPFTDNLVLTYKGAQDRTTNIHVKCSEGDATFTMMTPQAGIVYDFTLETHLACIGAAPSDTGHGLSTGSVLVILFFVFLIVYFTAGILYLKFARGATGKEAIPNYEWWVSLPGYIKDGVFFTVRGCKVDSSYSKI